MMLNLVLAIQSSFEALSIIKSYVMIWIRQLCLSKRILPMLTVLSSSGLDANDCEELPTMQENLASNPPSHVC